MNESVRKTERCFISDIIMVHLRYSILELRIMMQKVKLYLP